MTDEQIIKKFRKREKVMGTWMAERNYDAWDIYRNGEKWQRLCAVTKNPIQVMVEDNPFGNIDWTKVTAKKLT